MIFKRTITRLFVAGIVILSGSVCTLEAASNGSDVNEPNVTDVHAGAFDPVDRNDARWIPTNNTEFAPGPDAISLAIPLTHTKGSSYHPSIKAHRPRAPPRIHQFL
jgi:hypothetical protein